MSETLTFAIFIILVLSLIYELTKPKSKCYNGKKSRYLKACHAGFIRGAIAGTFLGGFSYVSAIQQGVMFGILNPLMIHLGY